MRDPLTRAQVLNALEESGAWRNSETGLWTWHRRGTKPEDIVWHSEEDALTITRACLYLERPVTDVVSGTTWLQLIERVMDLEERVGWTSAMRDEPHTMEHIMDPLAHNEKCETCNAILRRAFNDVMPGLELGPSGADMLLRRINEIARQLWAEDAAS